MLPGLHVQNVTRHQTLIETGHIHIFSFSSFDTTPNTFMNSNWLQHMFSF
jgi:hypothetical protein